MNSFKIFAFSLVVCVLVACSTSEWCFGEGKNEQCFDTKHECQAKLSHWIIPVSRTCHETE